MITNSKQIPFVLDGRNELTRVRFRLLPLVVPDEYVDYEMKTQVLAEIESRGSVLCLWHNIK